MATRTPFNGSYRTTDAHLTRIQQALTFIHTAAASATAPADSQHIAEMARIAQDELSAARETLLDAAYLPLAHNPSRR